MTTDPRETQTGRRQADIALTTTLRRTSSAPVGELLIDGLHLEYTALSTALRGIEGSSISPVHLFAGSLGACYALAFAQRLDAGKLAWSSVDILTRASLTPASSSPSFDSIMVHATVAGADATARSAYHRAAMEARDRCPIARSIRGNVAYKLGEVIVTEQSGSR